MPFLRLLPLAAPTFALLLASGVVAQPRLELLTEAVPGPMQVTHAGDDRLFIVEREGRVWIHENGALLPTPYLDVSAGVSTVDEGGLESIVFHPDYAQNGRSFVFFTEPSDPGLVLVVARFTVSAADPNRVDPASRRELLRLVTPSTVHNGGQLQFGPDGLLYVGLGDGGNDFGVEDPTCNAQEPEPLLGKLLRLDVDLANDAAPWYEIPATNPFAAAGDPSDLLADEIWALGLRNPFRFSFDKSSGALWLGDVGQDTFEEIDFQPASSTGGENYGWKVLEGTLCLLPGFPVGGSCPATTPPCDDPGYTPPVFEYPHLPDPRAAVTGGVVYRGSESPAFQGRYVFADSSIRAIWAFRELTPPYTAELLIGDGLASPVGIGEDRDGELYVADLFANRVYRLRLGTESATPDVACIVAANAASAKLAQSAAHELFACTLAGAKQTLAGGSVEACLVSDRRGAVAKRRERLQATAAARCSTPQPFGFASAAAAGDAAVESERELLHAVFGPDLDASLADARAASAVHRCQRDVHRRSNACQKTRRTEFLRCKKAGLKGGSVTSVAELAACLDADPKGRIARVCDAGLRHAVERSCSEDGVELAAAFPGCATGSAEELHACLDAATRCRHCRLFDAADVLGVNCDRYDDAAVNASCRPLE